ncbi:calcium-activated chloride channel-domain-containing protein [Fimicolochytrium jonesii]|uniref:calcium-activated chloride channel-domain-containing protein n=1 Tax=Fimicolochytrium jonesii TaxID=1396493 RepID=UPI0022FE7F8E|nr:calcium-activated chloride channel-domain-containing protein [Fimicolochytrium jonesii]KAI8821308.1 calcium-activated chloride channel-domain-containing protein [Fimicolochytrium jonesii]
MTTAATATSSLNRRRPRHSLPLDTPTQDDTHQIPTPDDELDRSFFAAATRYAQSARGEYPPPPAPTRQSSSHTASSGENAGITGPAQAVGDGRRGSRPLREIRRPEMSYGGSGRMGESGIVTTQPPPRRKSEGIGSTKSGDTSRASAMDGNSSDDLEKASLPGSPPADFLSYYALRAGAGSYYQKAQESPGEYCPHMHNRALPIIAEVNGGGYEDVVARVVDGRVVLLMYLEDVELFDEIVGWREGRGGVEAEDALKFFADRPHVDALTRIIFGPQSTEWDAILKYSVEPSSESSAIVRGLYTRQLLLANLFVEIEVDAESEGGCERYVKVMAPFDALTLEAERVKLRKSLKPLKSPSSGPSRPPMSPPSKGISTGNAYSPTGTASEKGKADPSTIVVEIATPTTTPDPSLRPPLPKCKQPWPIAKVFIRLARYMFTIQQCPKDHRTASFRRAALTSFVGGDPNEPGVGIEGVYYNFFRSARRIELTFSIMLHRTLDPAPGSPISKRTTIRDLLEDDVYTDWYPVHDCDVTAPRFGDKKQCGPRRPSLAEQAMGKRKRLREILFVEWVQSPFWVRLKGWITRDNADLVREYAGEQVAFYFDWLAFYTFWMLPAALFGLLVFTYGLFHALTLHIDPTTRTPSMTDSMYRLGSAFDNGATIAFTLGMSIWATVFIESWKRRQKFLAYVWDVSEYRREELIRPQWRPTMVTRNPLTRRIEKHDPYPNRILRRTWTNLVLGVCAMVLLGIVTGVIAYKAFVKATFTESRVVKWVLLSGVGGVIEIVQVLVVQNLYNRIAIKINNGDNYKYDSQFEDGLIFKTFLFSFINNYSAFFYTGVVKAMLGLHYVFGKYAERCEAISFGGATSTTTTTGDLSPAGATTDIDSSCMQEIMLQMAIIFVGLQFVRAGEKVAWPWIVQHLRATFKSHHFTLPSPLTPVSPVVAAHTSSPSSTSWRPTPASSGRKAIRRASAGGVGRGGGRVPQYAMDEALFAYDDWTLCQDYGMAVVQFGYIALFSCAFPLAPIFAIANNVVVLHIDSWKMLFEYRRPWAQRAQSIGLWTSILTVISTIGAPANALIIAFSSSTFATYAEHWAPGGNTFAIKLGFVIVFEHTILLIKALLTFLVPPLPGTVKRALRREAYLRRIDRRGRPKVTGSGREVGGVGGYGNESDSDDDEEEDEYQENVARQKMAARWGCWPW